MPSESGQDVKGRVRPTRVHITYKVDTNGAIKNVEIPFVVGVMGDFKGSPKKRRLSLNDPNRKFIEIASDNFNKVMKEMEPRITPRVKNRLANDGSELGLDLTFTKLEDFEPDNVVTQIKPLNELIQMRDKLVALSTKASGKQNVEELLQRILEDAEVRQQVSRELDLAKQQATKKEE